MKFDLLFRRRWWLLYAPILGVAVLLLWLSYSVWLPQPPTRLKISAGQPGDGTTQIALRYREQLAEMGVTAEIITHDQAHNALQAIGHSAESASLAIASGLHASRLKGADTPAALQELQSLAQIEREPIWLFSRSPQITRLQDLRGLRLGIAADDALADDVAKLILQHAQLKANDLQRVELPRAQLANQLIDSKLDAVMLLSQPSSDAVRLLTRSSGIHIIGLEQIRSLVQREPRLRPFVLPQGAIELRGDIPPRDLTMVSADLHLVIQRNMHPALQRALLDVASLLHERPSFLQRHGEFPRLSEMDFQPSAVAADYLRSGKPWLEQLLPYGWAQLAQWLLLAFLPIVLCTLALLAWIPTWFDWRVNAVLQNFYGELMFLETEIEPVVSERPIEIKRILQRIDEIDMQIRQLELPEPYAERWYTSRSHLAGARERLLDLRAR